MSPSATWLQARSVLRHTWRAALGLAVLIGVVTGLIAASLTGARRIEGSYERLLRDVDVPDLLIGAQCGDECTAADRDAYYATAIATIAAEPAVADITLFLEQVLDLHTADGTRLGPFPDDACSTGTGELTVVSGSWPRSGRPPGRILKGRFPSADSPTEIALADVTARRAGVHVGDVITATGGCHSAEDLFTAPFTMTVSGIFVGAFDVRPAGTSDYLEVIYSSMRFAEHAGLSTQGNLAVWLHPGRTIEDVPAELRTYTPFDRKIHQPLVEENLRPDALALRLFAAVAALAALAVLGQLLGRHVHAASTGQSALSALGARRRDRWLVNIWQAAAIGVGAAVTAMATLLVATPLIPLGAAEESMRGLSVRTTAAALALTALAAVVLVVVVAAGPAWLATRSDRRRRVPRYVAARAVDRLRLRPSTAWGVRIALEPSAGGQPVPVRTGLGAMTIAAAAVAGVVTFGAGLEHLRSTPRLVGYNWDFDIFAEDADAEALAATIADHPDVERVSAVAIFANPFATGPAAADALRSMAFGTGPRAVGPSLVSGRAPAGPDELLLAPAVAKRLGAAIGDEVDLYTFSSLGRVAGDLQVDLSGFGSDPFQLTTFQLVGIGVVFVQDGSLDTGASVTLDGVRKANPPPAREDVMQVIRAASPEALLANYAREVAELAEVERDAVTPEMVYAALDAVTDEEFGVRFGAIGADIVVVDLADGADPRRLFEALHAEGLVGDGYLEPGALDRPASTEDLAGLDLGDAAWIPAGFGILMGASAIAVLAHLVPTGARARRRDLAILRALGFNGRGVRTAIATQAVTLALVASAVAIPIGAIVGRIAWRRYATGLDVVPEPVTPWLQLGLVVVGLVIAAMLIAVIPAWLAVRRRPIESLRSE